MLNLLRRNFKIFRTLLVVDELSESNRIIKFLGLSFIILSCLYLLGYVNVSTIILICISLSGIFFIIGDIFEHFCKVQNQKKAIDITIRYKNISYLKIAKLSCQFLAIISLIIAPYVVIDLTLVTLSKVSNMLSILAIGLTIFKIGLDNSMKKAEFEEMITDELLREFDNLETLKDK